jgi:hypothetical protein
MNPGTSPEAPSSLPSAEQIKADLEALGLNVTDLEEQARAWIRDQPAAAMLAAAGLGFLVARLASRGNR